MPERPRSIPTLQLRALWMEDCRMRVCWVSKGHEAIRNRCYRTNRSYSVPANKVNTLAPLAMPDLFLAALLPALHTRTARNLLWIPGRGFLNVATLVLCNLSQRASGEDRCGSDLRNILIGGVIVAMLYQKPLTIPGSN